MPDSPRYEDDFYAWTQHQAAVLREMPVADTEFDREHVAEEIEALGRSERDAVRSRIRRIISVFLKLAYSSAEPPRFGWLGAIDDARQTLSDKITPTLRREAETMLPRLYRDGRSRAELALRGQGEHRAADELPATCPYTLDQILREDWYPDRAGAKP